MSLKGYTIPRTAEGRASLVPPPPWHYVGNFLVVDFWADPDAAVALLPAGLEPHEDPGRCSAVVAEWQGFSESGDELVDPSRSQYREAYVVVNAMLDGEEVDDLPVLLGRPGLRARPRLDPGVPEEARLGLADADVRPRHARRPGDQAGRPLRGHVLDARPARARDDRHTRA